MEGEVPGPSVSTDSRHMSTTLTHLENKISELKKFGDQLAMSMEGAAVNNVFYILCVFYVFSSPEQSSGRAVSLPLTSALALASALAKC